MLRSKQHGFSTFGRTGRATIVRYHVTMNSHSFTSSLVLYFGFEKWFGLTVRAAENDQWYQACLRGALL